MAFAVALRAQSEPVYTPLSPDEATEALLATLPPPASPASPSGVTLTLVCDGKAVTRRFEGGDPAGVLHTWAAAQASGSWGKAFRLFWGSPASPLSFGAHDTLRAAGLDGEMLTLVWT